MPITDMLSLNAQIYADEISLIERDPAAGIRREITWKEFDNTANRFANFLISRGIKPGDKVGLLLMNCLEWLPIYFGILKTGAWAVPLNFRFTADEIHKCMEVSEAKILIYGPEFIEAIKCVRKKAGFLKDYVFVGESVDNHNNDHLFSRIISEFSTHSPDISIADEDDAAL